MLIDCAVAGGLTTLEVGRGNGGILGRQNCEAAGWWADKD